MIDYVIIWVRTWIRPIDIDEQRKPALNAKGSPLNGGWVLFFRYPIAKTGNVVKATT